MNIFYSTFRNISKAPETSRFRNQAFRLLPALLVLLLPGLFLPGMNCSAQEDWLLYRGVMGAGATSNAIYPPLAQRWKLLLQKKSDKARYFNPPLVMGDTIYFGSNDNNFYAFDLDSGYRRWSFPTKAPVNSAPFADESRVYFGSNDGYVYALERDGKNGGKKIWSYNTGKTVQSLVLRYKDYVIFTSDLGATHFLDLNGKRKFQVPNKYWKHHTFQVYDDILYFAPRGRTFGAYDINRKGFLWLEREITGGSWYSFPALDDNLIYYARNQWRPKHRFSQMGDGLLTFWAKNRRTGAVVWEQNRKFQPGQRMNYNLQTVFMRNVDLLDYMAPSLWNNLAIFSAGDIYVRAFKRKSGKPAWRTRFKFPVSSAPTVAGDRVYVGIRGDEDDKGHPLKNGDKPKLVCLSAHDGRKLWELEVDGVILSAPVISGKRIMFGTSDYLFYVFEEIF